jgi:hypothetical protein
MTAGPKPIQTAAAPERHSLERRGFPVFGVVADGVGLVLRAAGGGYAGFCSDRDRRAALDLVARIIALPIGPVARMLAHRGAKHGRTRERSRRVP